MKNKEECYAVPGQTIIDLINPQTGLTQIYGKTLEQCQREDGPSVQRMTVDEFCQSKAEKQNVPVQWEETTEEKYYEMLEVLPPAFWKDGFFLVGEPWDHHAMTGQPRFQAFSEQSGTFCKSSRPMTITELKAHIDSQKAQVTA